MSAGPLAAFNRASAICRAPKRISSSSPFRGGPSKWNTRLCASSNTGPADMQNRPDKTALLEAVARFLATEVKPAITDPNLAFRVLVAANLAAVVAAEVATEEAQEEAE